LQKYNFYLNYPDNHINLKNHGSGVLFLNSNNSILQRILHHLHRAVDAKFAEDMQTKKDTATARLCRVVMKLSLPLGFHCRWALANGKRRSLKTGFSHHLPLSI